MKRGEAVDGAEAVVCILEAAVSERVVPGACLAWGRVGEPIRQLCRGFTARPGLGLRPRQVTAETVYDLASLTKVLCTTTAAMLLVQRGLISLDDPLGRSLPGWSSGPRARVCIRHLLAHEAGLPWWLPFFREVDAQTGAERRSRVRDRLLSLQPETEPGRESVYSDPGFLLLAMALEEAAQEPLATLVGRELWGPWGISPCFVDLDPHAEGPRQSAALLREELLAKAVVAPTERCPWRGRTLEAEVHDENAHFLGGIAPHAGLFSGAGDVLRFGLGLLQVSSRSPGSAPLLDPELLLAFWTGGSRTGGSTWALGWDTPSPGGSSGGSRISRAAVGHLGFTGTSLWIDPERGAAVVLLSNRVHPSRSDERIKLLRPRVHDAVWELLDREG